METDRAPVPIELIVPVGENSVCKSTRDRAASAGDEPWERDRGLGGGARGGARGEGSGAFGCGGQKHPLGHAGAVKAEKPAGPGSFLTWRGAQCVN